MKNQTTILAALAAVVLASALSASAALDAYSYVQRGLAACYDGIDNAGTGTHDPSATVWKDLTGNGNDGTCDTSKLSWSADGWSVSGGCKPVTIPAPGLAATMGTCNFTIQFACTPAMDNKREAFFSQYSYTGAYGALGLEHNNGGNFTGRIRYYKFRSRTSSTDQRDELTSATVSAGTFTSASIAMTPMVQKCWLNGTLADTRNMSLSMVSYSCNSVIGGEPQGSSARTGDTYTSGYGITFQGKYNAFRLYDRPLSEDEAKVNAAVDAIRFNGANPGDFSLTGGWSFDGAGDLCVDVAAAASGNGTVTVNGGVGPVTVKQYASPVALAAVPASGFVFYRWEGDTDAIVSGSTLAPSIEVSTSDPVSLVAVFKAPATGLDAYSYIRKGLVANFDGIDNTGTGAHDSSATAWIDLTGNGNNATKGSNASWNGTDGWTASADGKPMTIPEAGGAATTVAAVTATKVFTAQFAVKPSRSDARQSFFGQWDKKGVCIEHNSGDSSKPGYIRAYYNYLSGGTAGDDKFTSILVTANEWASMSLLSDTARQTVWKNGESSQTKNTSLGGTLTNMCPSVIGGDNARANMGFRGTYNAFRLYNRVLSDDEVKVNAVIDDRRFNGGAKNLALPSGWSFADDILMVDVSATATEGGKVSYRGGAVAATVSDTVNHDGSKVVTFAAIPDAGYVFDRWSGDIDLIVLGSTITEEITVDPDRPVTLVANFRRNGDAADGLKFDIDFTGNASADGVTFSATSAGEAQGYAAADVTLPALPTVTNENATSIYFPQPTNTAAGVFRQDARIAGVAVTGQVATVFVRFRWDGSVLPDVVNYPAIVMNGYTSWSLHPREGFCLRLRADKNATRGNFSLIVPGLAVPYNSAGITTTGIAYVNAGQWVDAFVSVYPSPTDPALSTADVWYRQVPTWFDDDGNFGESQPGHRHFGDGCAIPRMDTATQRTIIFGSEPNAAADAITGDNAVKVFRGAIAAARGWNRLLSENEMWTVMAEFGGVQSFTDLETNAGRTFETGTLTTLQGRNGTQTAFVGDADTSHFWRALSTTYPSLALLWDAPKDADSMPVIYRTSVKSIKSGLAQPIHLECNGATVWSAADVATGDEIRVEIGAEHTLPGLNELRWVYDTGETSNWVQFKNHWLRLVTPGKPFTMVIR